MARIQILELPEGSSDDRPPFVLVIDESVPQRYILGPDDNPVRDYWQDIAATIGACGVIVTPETVDIPANDVPLDADGNPLFLKVHIEGGFEQFREQAEEEIRSIQHRMTTTSLGVDYGELADAVQDSLGITPGSGPANVAGWLLTACRELKKSEAARDHLREERAEARQWARHGYEVGQKHCSWSDHGVAPAWLTEGWPPHIDGYDHLQHAVEYDTALTRVRNLPEQPEVMDARHPDPSGYLHGYGVAIRDAKRATYPPQLAESGDTERSPEE